MSEHKWDVKTGLCRKCGMSAGAHMASGWFLAFDPEARETAAKCPEGYSVIRALMDGLPRETHE